MAVATEKCAAEGAKGCKPTVTYYNQCVAFAVPSFGKGQGSLDTAADEETVSKNAIGNCKDSGGGNCHVVYSECSLPVFRSFCLCRILIDRNLAYMQLALTSVCVLDVAGDATLDSVRTLAMWFI